MLVTFFDSQEIIHKEFVPPCQTANKQYYAKVMPRFVQEFVELYLSFGKKEAGSSCMTTRDLTLQYQ
jgi:hypothetical protein